MATLTVEIPDAVIEVIREKTKVEPATYLQKEIVTPIVKIYEEALQEKRQVEVKQSIESDVAEAKKQIKVNSKTKE